MKINEAAKAAGVSRQAIYAAIKNGRITATRENGYLEIEESEIKKARVGLHHSTSGIIGVSWSRTTRRWRAQLDGKIIFTSTDKDECAKVLEKAREGKWTRQQRDLPHCVFRGAAGNLFVKIIRGGVIFRESAETVEEAIMIRDNFLGKFQKK